MFFFFLKLILYIVVAQLLAPKPNVKNAVSGTLDDIKFPSASDKPIPILWGTVRQQNPNNIWYGDFSSDPIIERVGGGLFSSGDDVVVGHKYYLGFQMGLTFGPDVKLKKIRSTDKVIFDSNIDNFVNGRGLIGSKKYKDLIEKIDNGEITGIQKGLFTIPAQKRQIVDHYVGNKPEDYEFGGYFGEFEFFDGDNLTKNTYLVETLAPVQISLNKRLSYCVFEGVYIGANPNPQKIDFELERIPVPLFQNITHDSNNEKIGDDANPAYILYEILTDDFFGRGIPKNLIDEQNIEDIATILKSEEFGLSIFLNTTAQAKEIIEEILRHINGNLIVDKQTGQYKIKLIRDDYDENLIEEINDSNITKINSFQKGSIEQMYNEVRVRYIDRIQNYEERYITANNLALRQNKNASESLILDYSFIKDKTLASKVANRDLNSSSINVSNLEFETTRELFDLEVGDVFKLNTNKNRIKNSIYRVMSIDLGEIDSPNIKIIAKEDIFNLTDEFFEEQESEFEEINYNAKNIEEFLDLYLPKEIILKRFPLLYTQEPNIENLELSQFNYWPKTILAARPDNQHLSFDIECKESTNEISTSFKTDNSFSEILYDLDNFDRYDTEIVFQNLTDRNRIFNTLESQIRESQNIAIMYDLIGTFEYIAFETLIFDDNIGKFKIQNIKRGLFGTSPKETDDFINDINIFILNNTSKIYNGFDMGQIFDDDIFPKNNGDEILLPTKTFEDSEFPSNSKIISNNSFEKFYGKDKITKEYCVANIEVDGVSYKQTTTGLNFDLSFSRRNRQQEDILFFTDTNEEINNNLTYEVRVREFDDTNTQIQNNLYNISTNTLNFSILGGTQTEKVIVEVKTIHDPNDPFWVEDSEIVYFEFYLNN